jgi:hypothetical protein
MSEAANIHPDFYNEINDIQVGEILVIANVWHAQGQVDPHRFIGQKIKIEGVNYNHHWVWGLTEDGHELGLLTFCIRREEWREKETSI